jgi:large subunit ribosomal protein L18
MNKQRQKIERRTRRSTRVRSVVSGSASRPRLAVFRANQNIYAQLIDDINGKTLASASTLKIKTAGKAAAKTDSKATGKADSKAAKTEDKTPKSSAIGNKTDSAAAVGKAIAEKAIELKIKEVVFDRGGFKYHGRVKALAEAARGAGLKF